MSGPVRLQALAAAGPGFEQPFRKRFPIAPARPDRTCWGCDKYCPAGAMACGNGSDRTQHPIELFGPGWERGGLDPFEPAPASESAAPPPAAPAS